MSHVKIVIQALEDVKNITLQDIQDGNGLIKGATKENTAEAKDITVAILEGGMVSGKAVVMIALEMHDRTFSIGQISEDNFEMVYSAFKASMLRFQNIKDQE